MCLIPSTPHNRLDAREAIFIRQGDQTAKGVKLIACGRLRLWRRRQLGLCRHLLCGHLLALTLFSFFASARSDRETKAIVAIRPRETDSPPPGRKYAQPPMAIAAARLACVSVAPYARPARTIALRPMPETRKGEAGGGGDAEEVGRARVVACEKVATRPQPRSSGRGEEARVALAGARREALQDAIEQLEFRGLQSRLRHERDTAKQPANDHRASGRSPCPHRARCKACTPSRRGGRAGWRRVRVGVAADRGAPRQHIDLARRRAGAMPITDERAARMLRL